MRFSLIHIIMLVLVAISCSKEDDSTLHLLLPESIKVLEESNIRRVTDLSPGDGVALITYLTMSNNYKFKLISNSGLELWTYTSDLFYSSSEGSVVNGVLYNADGSFDVVYKWDLLRISANGELIFHNQNFFSGIDEDYSIEHVSLNANGDYLLMGNAYLGGDRAFCAGFNSEGAELFKKFFFIHATSAQSYTSSINLPDDYVLLAGSFKSVNPGFDDAYFVSKLSPEGALIWTKVHPFADQEELLGGSFAPTGRDLLQLDQNRFVYLINPVGEEFNDHRLRLVYFDTTGTETGDHTFINFAHVNNTSGSLPYTGRVISQKADGTIVGVARNYYLNNNFTFDTDQITYSTPEYSFFFELKPTTGEITAEYLNRDYNNYLTCTALLSDGKIMLAGLIDSFGNQTNIVIVIR